MKYSTVFKGISWLFLSTIASQAISLLTLPYISRAYEESSLSVMGIMASSLVLLTILSTLRMEFYIVKKTDKENKEFIPSLYLLAILSGMLLSPFLLLFFNHKNIDISIYTALLIITYIICSLILNISLLNLTNNKRFAVQASIRVMKSIILLSSLWLLSTLETTGVILSLVISTAAPLLWYITKNHSEFTRIFSGFTNKKEIILSQLKTSYHAAIQAVLNVINLQFISFYVIIFGSTNLIAAYFFMERIINAPLNLMASSLRQVLYKDFVEHSKNKKSLLKRYFTYQAILLVIALFMLFLFKIYGEVTIDYVLGGNWSSVYTLANIYILVIAFQIINIPTTSMFLTIDKMKTLSNLEKIDLTIKLGLAFYSQITSMEFINFLTLITIYISLYYTVLNSSLYFFLYSNKQHD